MLIIYYRLKPPEDLVDPEPELEDPLLKPPPELPDLKPLSLELFLAGCSYLGLC